MQMIRLTIRATDDLVPAMLLRLMQERIAAGSPIHAELPDTLSREDISNSFGSVMVT